LKLDFAVRAKILPLVLISQIIFAAPVEVVDLGDRPFRHAPEKLLFHVSYLYILGGYAVMETRHVASPSRTEFVLRAWTTPFVSALYRLDMTLTSRCDPETLTTREYSEDRHEKKHHIFHRAVFGPGNTFVYGHLARGRTNDETYPMDRYRFDALSSFYIARCLDLSKVGAIYRTTVYYHNDIHQVEIRVVDRRRIKTAWGPMDTVVIVPKMSFRGIFMNEGDIFIYLSDDKYLAPVYMESKLSFGSFRAALKEGYPGAAQSSPKR
jgi:hypothetical protein